MAKRQGRNLLNIFPSSPSSPSSPTNPHSSLPKLCLNDSIPHFNPDRLLVHGRDAKGNKLHNQPAYHQASTEEGAILPLAINLHYVLTAYGNKDFQTEILLGYVMQFMHQTPVLSNATIRAALNHVATINRSGFLAQVIESTSVEVLTEQLDQVRIALNLFDTEQMSKLWSLLQGSYRPSIAYEVSMVFIGSKKPSLAPASSKGALNQPQIEKIVASLTNSEILAGSSLILYGKNLNRDLTRIRLNESKSLLEPQFNVTCETVWTILWFTNFEKKDPP